MRFLGKLEMTRDCHLDVRRDHTSSSKIQAAENLIVRDIVLVTSSLSRGHTTRFLCAYSYEISRQARNDE